MNPMALLQLKTDWSKFQKRHPKFSPFLTAVSKQGIKEESIIEINVTTPEGHTFHSNLKVTREDAELIQKLLSGTYPV